MIRVNFSSRGDNIKPRSLKTAFRKVLRAGMNAGKKAVVPAVRQRYTYKRSVAKTVRAKLSGLIGEITIKDRRHPATDFQLKKPTRKSYAHLTVVRGQGGTLPRAFMLRGRLFERVGQPKYPIHVLKSVSTAQMAGHRIPSRMIEQAIENRVDVELGGALERIL